MRQRGWGNDRALYPATINGITNLCSLKGLPLNYLDCHDNAITDLVPLAGMNLYCLLLNKNRVTDLAPVKNMPLLALDCTENQISDMTPVAGLPLRRLFFAPKFVTTGIAAIRGLKTLAEINCLPAAEFWKKYDAGEFGKQGE